MKRTVALVVLALSCNNMETLLFAQPLAPGGGMLFSPVPNSGEWAQPASVAMHGEKAVIVTQGASLLVLDHRGALLARLLSSMLEGTLVFRSGTFFYPAQPRIDTTGEWVYFGTRNTSNLNATAYRWQWRTGTLQKLWVTGSTFGDFTVQEGFGDYFAFVGQRVFNTMSPRSTSLGGGLNGIYEIVFGQSGVQALVPVVPRTTTDLLSPVITGAGGVLWGILGSNPGEVFSFNPVTRERKIVPTIAGTQFFNLGHDSVRNEVLIRGFQGTGPGYEVRTSDNRVIYTHGQPWVATGVLQSNGMRILPYRNGFWVPGTSFPQPDGLGIETTPGNWVSLVAKGAPALAGAELEYNQLVFQNNVLILTSLGAIYGDPVMLTGFAFDGTRRELALSGVNVTSGGVPQVVANNAFVLETVGTPTATRVVVKVPESLTGMTVFSVRSGLVTGLNTLSVTLPGPPPPTITSLGNSADGGGLAPGSLATVFGQNLGPDAEVLVEYQPAPVLFHNGTQLNFQIPYEMAAPGRVVVQVRSRGVTSTTREVELVQSSPAFFLHQGFAILTDPETGQVAGYEGVPATAGRVYTSWLTGCGPTMPAMATGQPAPSNPLATTFFHTGLSLNGREAEVLWSGMAPGLIGVCQMNFLMPTSLAGANRVAGELQIGSGRGRFEIFVQ